MFFCNFGNLFSDETRKTLRNGAVPTLNLPIKSQASKQSDDVPPVNISLYMLMIKPKPTVPSGLGQQKKITVL